MRTVIKLIIGFGLALPFAVMAQGNGISYSWDSTVTNLWMVSNYGTNTYEFEVTASDIAKTPEWHEGEDLPLPPRKALQSAKKELEQLVGDTEQWKLSFVEITPYIDGKHWFYRVGYIIPLAAPRGAFIQEKTPSPQSMTIPVLMDGTVVRCDIRLLR
jgi:hypothetical protein